MKYIIINISTQALFLVLLMGISTLLSGQNKLNPDSVETVEIAYGTLAKNSVTSSVNSISGKDIEKNTVFSLGNALFGRLPGLFLQSSSGKPGSDQPTMTIRGRGTFGTNNAPLVIVDGVERDMNMVSIEDIESISILKDASATVLYGGRAANGVIMVTTKRGLAGKNKIFVNVQQGIRTPNRLPRFVSSARYACMYNQALENDGLAARFTEDDIQGFETGDPYFYPNVNWIDEMIRKASLETHANANMTGGNKIGRYYVSLGYAHSTGLYKHTNLDDNYSTNDNLNRINFRSNLDINLLDELRISLDLGGQVNMKNAPVNSSANIWNNLYTFPSYIPVYVSDGSLGGTSTYRNNPMGYINHMGYANTNDRYFMTGLKLNYDMSSILKELTFMAAFGYDNFYTVTDSWSKTFLVKEIIGKDTSGDPVLSEPIGQTTNLTYNEPGSDAQERRFNFDFQFNYSQIFNKIHTLDASVLYHQDRLTLGPENPYTNILLGGRIHYGLKNRYLLDIAASYSGSEAFAKGYRFGLFPALSAGWVLSDEHFFGSNDMVNFLKLRGSAGIVGNDEVGERFSYRQLYTSGTGYNMGSANSGLSGLVESTIANKRMTFEKSFQYELGIEGRLLGLLDVTASWYKQHRTNILTSQSSNVPDLFGGTLSSVNSGKVDVKGFDIGLNLQKETEDWEYQIGLNVTHAKSKVIFMSETLLPANSEYGYHTGHPVSQPFGLIALGLFQSQEEIENSPVQQFGEVMPGDIKYKDVNEDGYINDFDKTSIAKSTYPETEVGVILGGRYKNFDLQAIFQAQLGRDIYLGNTPKIYWALKDDANISTYALNAWTEENNAIADYPRLTTMESANNFRSSTFWYKDADFLRLRSLEIGYNFPNSMDNRLKMRNIRLFLRGMNLFTINKFDEADPELFSGYPAANSYYLGLRVQF